MSENKELLEKLAGEFVELHQMGAIELDLWQTALEFVNSFGYEIRLCLKCERYHQSDIPCEEEG